MGEQLVLIPFLFSPTILFLVVLIRRYSRLTIASGAAIGWVSGTIQGFLFVLGLFYSEGGFERVPLYLSEIVALLAQIVGAGIFPMAIAAAALGLVGAFFGWMAGRGRARATVELQSAARPRRSPPAI